MKVTGLILPLIIAAALGCGIASGAVFYSHQLGFYSVTRPANLMVNVVGGLQTLELAPGQYSANFTVTVKNDGGAAVPLYIQPYGLVSGVQLIIYEGQNLYAQGSNLTPSETVTLKMCLYADPGIATNIPLTQFGIDTLTEAP